MPKDLLNEEEITLEKLREQFQNNDFTKTALKPYSEYTLKEVEFHNEIRSYVHESWRKLLKDFGIKHPESCFSKNYPPELVREYLEKLVADIIISMQHDEIAFENIVKTFVAPILAQENCDELADRYLHNTVNALMQTVDIKELAEVSKENSCEEDFGNGISANYRQNYEESMMSSDNTQCNYNFIDLFAGAGGLSEGFLQAGFKPVAHVEMNEFAAKTLETRSAYYFLKSTNRLGIYKKYLSGKIARDEFIKQIPASIIKTIINETMSDKTLPVIFKTIDGIMKIRGISKIDVIVGGPPCQAYSLVGRAQSSHMEIPMAEDPRNYLYKLYARFLKRYQPRMFVFENVTGIESANGGATWKNIQKYLKGTPKKFV